MNGSILVSWIGSTDLKAAKGEGSFGTGPVAQVVSVSRYAQIHLLSNFPADQSQAFSEWLSIKTNAEIEIHYIDLSSPTNHREIYLGVIPILNSIVSTQVSLTYNLSSGIIAIKDA